MIARSMGLVLVLAAAAQAARAQTDDARIRAAAERVSPQMVELRHQIHQNPELGNREFHTAELVASQLRALGLEVRTGVAHTGVIGILRGGRPGPVVAVRADMDALPVTENTDLPFRSTVRSTYLGQDVGVAHACGHDVHVAVQLGVASVLAGMRAQLPGTVVFIFQPAEEGAPPGERGGAQLMLEEGAFANPRPAAIFGLHARANLDVGRMGFTTGPALAASNGWRAVVHGRPSHGAVPQLAIDPIVMASEIVMALQTIRSRNLSPLAPSVVTVGIIRGGERLNIIPADVEMQGTIRSFDTAVQDTIKRRMREIFDGITRMHDGSATLEFDAGTPVTVNDSALGRRMWQTVQRVVGPANAVVLEPWSASEDFSYFANAVPGFFFSLGTQKPGTVSGGHHTPTFRADDAAIPPGIAVMSGLLLDYLSGAGRAAP
jgi:amidohydrolase